MYRAIRTDNKQYIYGSLMQFEDGITCIMPIQKHENLQSLMFYEVEPNTVGQCTQVKDKNEKNIYEGDVVAFKLGNGKYGKLYEVFYDTSEGMFLLAPDGNKDKSATSFLRGEMEIVSSVATNKNLYD